MIITYRFRVKGNSAKKLKTHAFAVNQVWNFCVATQREVQSRWRAGKSIRWPSYFDLARLTKASRELGLHSHAVRATCAQFARSRDQFKRCPKFRASFGPKRALGWVPVAARACKFDGCSVTFMGQRYRYWNSREIEGQPRTVAFVEDARGRWYVCVTAEVAEAPRRERKNVVGVDLGLKTLAVLSDGTRIENPRTFKQYERALAKAQRAGNKKRAKAIHAKIANVRKDFLHKATTALVKNYDFIAVGDVNAAKLKKTKMGKSVSDAAWSMFRQQCLYKARRLGAVYVEVPEAFTSQRCSCCGCIPVSSPKGMGALGIRAWKCSDCETLHDRDVNAARNILALGLEREPLVGGIPGL